MNNLSVTLSNFILMEEAESEEFEVYLLICKDGQMSAGCYTTGTNYQQGATELFPLQIICWRKT